MVETEFHFWVPSSSTSGGMLCHHESSSDAASDDTFPLLSSDHVPGDLSPTSRLRRIEEGRKELMEMIRNVPESYYELSLKDIVVDLRQRPRPVESGLEVDDEQGKKKKKRMRTKDISARPPGRVTRTSSMEAGSFLIRMFLPVPAFLRQNKKQQPASSSGNSSKTLMSSTRASLYRSDGRWPLTRDEWRSREGTSRSKSCTSRIEHVGGGFFSGCLPFGGLNNSKGKVMIQQSKMTRQKTCMF